MNNSIEEKFKYSGTDNLEMMLEAKKYNNFLASLVTKQNLSSCSKVLDIGAGIGLFADILKIQNITVDCLEPDRDQAILLNKKGFKTYLYSDEIPDNYYDMVYAFNVLEHIEDDQEILFTWLKKLKSGGIILVYVPAFNVLYSSMDKKVGHYRRYRIKDLTKKFENTELVVLEKAKYVDSLGFFASLTYKWIDKSNGSLNKKSLIFYDRAIFPLSRLIDIILQKILGKNVYVIAKKR